MKKFGVYGLLFIGFITGVIFVYSCDGGGSASAVVTKTGYYSLGIENFHYFDLTDNVVQAPINLPHNSKITSITAFFTDSFGPGYISVGLYTTSLDGVLVDEMYISSETVSGNGSVTVNILNGITIDNLNNSYSWVWPIPVGPPWDALHLDSVLIEYEYET